MTGFILLHSLRISIILPGCDPIYVKPCPFNTDESDCPPSVIVRNGLSKASAMLLHNSVFPKPRVPYNPIAFILQS